MLYQDQLFQVFADEKSDHKDIVIRMYHTASGGTERFLCVDLQENAVDFLEPTEYPPTRFVLNVPSCQIVKSSLEIHHITKKQQSLTKKNQTLRNETAKEQEMEV